MSDANAVISCVGRLSEPGAPPAASDSGNIAKPSLIAARAAYTVFGGRAARERLQRRFRGVVRGEAHRMGQHSDGGDAHHPAAAVRDHRRQKAERDMDCQ
jgi:hypothetical protein